MSFSDWEVRIEKNFAQGLEWTDRGCRSSKAKAERMQIAFIVGFANDACKIKTKKQKSIETPVTDSRNF